MPQVWPLAECQGDCEHVLFPPFSPRHVVYACCSFLPCTWTSTCTWTCALNSTTCTVAMCAGACDLLPEHHCNCPPYAPPAPALGPGPATVPVLAPIPDPAPTLGLDVARALVACATVAAVRASRSPSPHSLPPSPAMASTHGPHPQLPGGL